MEYQTQVLFKENPKMYEYLKNNSFYIKKFDTNEITFKEFTNEMKKMYKETVPDKIEKAIDNIELVSNVLEILKWLLNSPLIYANIKT